MIVVRVFGGKMFRICHWFFGFSPLCVFMGCGLFLADVSQGRSSLHDGFLHGNCGHIKDGSDICQ